MMLLFLSQWCLLSASFSIKHVQKSSLFRVHETGTVNSNFIDDAVDCISEGASIALNPSQDFASLSVQTLDASKKSKESNFEDDEVDCTSEGGNWSVDNKMLSSTIQLPSVGKPPSLKTAKDGFNLIMDCLSVESSPSGLVQLCDKMDTLQDYDQTLVLRPALEAIRYHKLVQLLKSNRESYIETATFLSNRIARKDLPNLEGVRSVKVDMMSSFSSSSILPSDTIADCALPSITFSESPLDKFLLGIFRGLVQREIGWKSELKGIKGLLEEGRHFMLSEEGTPEKQHAFVKTVLAGLMTPVLPPFYRIFMAGKLPSARNGDPQWLEEVFQSVAKIAPEKLQTRLQPGQQFGPWFYAPYLTSFVTPVFLSFLVGPSKPNRRADGQLGGIIIEVRTYESI